MPSDWLWGQEPEEYLLFEDDKAWQSYPTVVCWQFYQRFDSWPIPNSCHPLDLFMANLREVARANNDSSGYVKSNKTNLFKGAFKAWVSNNIPNI